MNKHVSRFMRGHLRATAFCVAIFILSSTANATGAPALTLSTAKLSFGNLAVGATSTPQSVVLTNSGAAAAMISSIAVAGSMADDFPQSTNCGATLAPAKSCIITVLFTPVSATKKTATLVISDDAVGSPQSVSLSGGGTGAPQLHVSPGTLAFGHQIVGATSAAAAVTVQNTGTAPISFTSIAVVGSMADDFPQANNCGTSLTAGASCTINVFFAPVSATKKTAILAISDNVTGSPQQISLSGSGIASAGLRASTTFLNFGTIALGSATAAQVVTVNNSTSSAIGVTAITLTGPQAGDFTEATSCGASVAPGGNCSISIAFKPSTTASESATLSIADNSGNPPNLVTVSGTGAVQAPTLTQVSPTTVVTNQAVVLTVRGGGFTAASAVLFSGNFVPTTFVSATKLTASIPAASLTYAGSYSISVSSSQSSGNGSQSNFAYITALAAPTISALSPNSVVAGSAAFSLVVSGSNFTQSSQLLWGSKPVATALVYSGQLTAAITAALVQNAGTVQVTVRASSDSGAPVSNALPFKIGALPPLALNAISPSTVLVGSPNTQLSISGQGFVPAAVVNLRGTPLPTTYVSQSQLLTQVPSSSLKTIGNAPITVTNSAAVNGTTSAIPLKITAAMPDSTAFQITPSHSGAITFKTLTFPTTSTWSVDVGGTPSYALIAEGKVVVTVKAGANTHLLALDQVTGAVVWGPVQLAGVANAAYDGGKIFVVSGPFGSAASMLAYDLSTGKPEWASLLTGQYAFTSGPTALHGMVYTGGAGSGGTLYALNAGDGSFAWTKSVANGDDSTPAVTDTGVYVSYPCQTYAFQPATGASLFFHNTGCDGGGGGTPVVANNTLYSPDGFGSFSGDTFDAASGKLLGSFIADTLPAFSTSSGFFLQSGTLNGITLNTDTISWSFTGDGALVTTPIVVNQTVIVGSSSGNVYAVDALTGKQLWHADAGGAIPAGAQWGSGIPLSGLAAGDGLLIVPAGNKVVAYTLSSTP